jgi:(E)-4-hydroxy-3-methylbut-2-enyl-diphosphate synthase
VPIIGDIHFNHKIALKAMELGIDGIRINPGTINNLRKVREVAVMALNTQTPVRLGMNIGSIEKRVLKTHTRPNADAMVESALYHINLFEDVGWTQLKVSLKASDIRETIDAYKKFSKKSDYPLTGNPVYEVIAGYHILRDLGLRKRGINIISCPTCGRTRVNLAEIVEEFEKDINQFDSYLDVAIMGCEVNGPGEAREADIGLAFGANSAMLFKKGTVVKSAIPREMAKKILEEEIYNMINEEKR